MMMAKPMNIAVVGAGLMGHGIAQVFAVAGRIPALAAGAASCNPINRDAPLEKGTNIAR